MPNIFYFCPDLPFKSAGVRTIYRHVAHLVKSGMPASVLRQNAGFRILDAPAVPVRYLSAPDTLNIGDIVVIPEGSPAVMAQLKDTQVRRFALCQNWNYIFSPLPAKYDWRSFGIERALAYPESTARFIQWSMSLPVHVFEWGIRADLFAFDPSEKTAQFAYITRKQENRLETLLRVLYSRNPDYILRIRWFGMDGLSEEDYARELRRSTAFVNLSLAEGLYAPYLEAMRCGTIVAGYGAVGARQALVGTGPGRNCITAENGDYAALAMALEPLLQDILRGDLSAWGPVIRNAREYTEQYTLEREEKSVVAIWRQILGG